MGDDKYCVNFNEEAIALKTGPLSYPHKFTLLRS